MNPSCFFPPSLICMFLPHSFLEKVKYKLFGFYCHELFNMMLLPLIIPQTWDSKSQYQGSASKFPRTGHWAQTLSLIQFTNFVFISCPKFTINLSPTELILNKMLSKLHATRRFLTLIMYKIWCARLYISKWKDSGIESKFT